MEYVFWFVGIVALSVVAGIFYPLMAKATRAAKEEQERTTQKYIEEFQRATQAMLERERKEKESREKLEEDLLNRFSRVLVDLVFGHAKTLYKKRSQCLCYDDYGKLQGMEQWNKEITYFRDKVIDEDERVVGLRLEALDAGVSKILDTPLDWLYDIVSKCLDEMETNIDRADVCELTGSEYEVHCAEILEQSGWSVVRKGGSGDQGVDLIACLGQLRVAIQCKRYSQPVGNKAVQEVNAGRQFEHCDLAVVVSNADYTSAARQLASALGVILLHHQDLGRFHEQVESIFPALVSGEVSA